MKHILYIHQYFKTPNEPGGTRSYWIARKLIEHGYKVTMLTSSASIEKKVEKKDIDGISVIYLKVPYDQNMGVFKRLLSFGRFMILSTYHSYKVPHKDLVISTSTPLSVGFPALLLKKIKKVPYVFEVRDLWPEVPIQMGAVNNKLAIKFLRKFEKIIYENSLHVVALSPGMKEGVLQHIDENKVTVIPNMSKIDEFWPREKNIDMMKTFNLDLDSFKVIHFGALGLANGAHYILDAAKTLKNKPEIVFLFVGGGSMESELIKFCNENQLSNVKFLGRFSMKDTSEIVNFSDVSMVSFLDIPILYTNSPNKLFDSLSAAKPIIVNSAGWTKDLVEDNGCGYYVNPKNPNELVETLLFLKSNPKIVLEKGKLSRKLAESKYDKSILCEEFAQLIENNFCTSR